MVIFLNTRPGKRPNFYMKVNVTEPRRKEFAALCMLRCVLLPPEKRSWGNYSTPSRKRRIPFRAPFYSLFSIFPCMCAYMVLPLCQSCKQSYSENESRTTASAVLSSPPVSLQAINSAEKHLSHSISILCYPGTGRTSSA